MFLDALLDSLIDVVKMLPVLFITYLIMEVLEQRSSARSSHAVSRSGRLGPLFGGIAGIFPQCGFSAAGANLYAGGVITVGTLMAIFLSTSDEMLPIFISEMVHVDVILRVLALKLFIAVISGFAVDWAKLLIRRYRRVPKDIHDLCEQDHCHCESGSIWTSTLKHTIQIALFILVATFLINLGIAAIGEKTLADFLASMPFISVFLAALVGLIPSCAPSVIFTELFLQGLLGTPQMMAGLLVNAGVGLLVLLRSNRHWKENAKVIAVLYVLGAGWGLLLQLLNVQLM